MTYQNTKSTKSINLTPFESSSFHRPDYSKLTKKLNSFLDMNVNLDAMSQEELLAYAKEMKTVKDAVDTNTEDIKKLKYQVDIHEEQIGKNSRLSHRR